MSTSIIVAEADVTLTTSETVADTDRTGRTFLSLTNNGATNVYVYYTTGATGGYDIVEPGEVWIDNCTNRIVYYKSASGTNSVHKLVAALV